MAIHFPDCWDTSRHICTARPAFGAQRENAIINKMGLTRISLVETKIAEVAKISTGNPQDDFSVFNEQVCGDIYLSVPEGFGRQALSLFATSKPVMSTSPSAKLRASRRSGVYLKPDDRG